MKKELNKKDTEIKDNIGKMQKQGNENRKLINKNTKLNSQVFILFQLFLFPILVDISLLAILLLFDLKYAAAYHLKTSFSLSKRHFNLRTLFKSSLKLIF